MKELIDILPGGIKAFIAAIDTNKVTKMKYINCKLCGCCSIKPYLSNIICPILIFLRWNLSCIRELCTIG